MYKKIFFTVIISLFINVINAQEKPEKNKIIEQNFMIPPNSARPQTWWHWMDGNVTQEGIKADLESLKGIGMGGVQLLEIGYSIPEGPVGYHDSLQMRMYETAFKTAEKLDMEMVLHNCPGWSSSGGPWVEPFHAMKQFVWSEKVVKGNGEKQFIILPQPYTKLGFYRDSYLVAFPTPEGEEIPVGKLASLSGNDGIIGQQTIADGDWASIYAVKKGNDGANGYVQFSFKESFTARAITIVPAVKKAPVSGVLQFSEDGKSFKNISRFSVGQWRSLEELACISFEPVKGRYFRVVFDQEAIIREIELTSGPRIHNYPEKTGIKRKASPDMDHTRQIPSKFAIVPEQVLNLSSLLKDDGTLTWEVPPGNWTILRFGYTVTGQRNIVPPTTGDGLEIDKLSTEAVDMHFDAVFGTIKKNLGPVAGKYIDRTFIDSYEVGMQNWTDRLPEEFKKRKGYDLTSYIPVLTGRFVKDTETSEKFLWDFRKNLADMFADNYVDHFWERCKEEGILLAIEPYGDGPFDDFRTGSRADIPMGEFWSRLNHDMRRTRLPAMLAHTYGMRVNGNQIVEAESFTGAPAYTSWKNSPYSMKTQGDLVFCQGVNRFVFHTYPHQPHPNAAPGMTMGKWGIHFQRNNTWFSKAEPWISYISRCQYLLQQGNNVADLCYFAGENSPVECLYTNELMPPPPQGYDYDVANTEVVLTRMKVEDGLIVLPDGVSYRLLIFPDQSRLMTVEVLQGIQNLLKSGAHILCNPPLMSPSLADQKQIRQEEYNALVKEIWGTNDGQTKGSVRYGKGNIYWGSSVEEIFKKINCIPDFEYKAKNPDAVVNYIHRKIDDTDVYFLANRLRRPEEITAEFRILGKQPELWDPEKGTFEILPLFAFEDGKTKIPINIDEAGSMFIVFREQVKDSPVDKLPEAITGARVDLSGVKQNFTISAWIKPESNIALPTETIKGMNTEFGKGCVVVPPPGDILYGPGHRTVGFAAGINGVIVFEKDSENYPAVLVAETPVSGWTHIAVVYVEGKPKLYLDGKLIKEGLKSGSIIHPGLSYPHKRFDVAYFEGDATEPELTDSALSEGEIKARYSNGLPDPELKQEMKLKLNENKFSAEVFRNGTYTNPLENKSKIRVNDIKDPKILSGPWDVSFDSSAKKPGAMVMEKLISWIESDNEDLKYFSGTANYKQVFNLDKSWLKEDQRLYLDLGRVEVLAEVRLNGKDLGILWKPPYHADITKCVKQGENHLEIKVTNLWPNRLIGDATLPTDVIYEKAGNILELPDWYKKGLPMPEGSRSTFVTWEHFNGSEALLESGLLGPVRVYGSKVIYW